MVFVGKRASLTCRSTNPSATAALYRTYINHSSPTETPFYLFLRTICANPKHAALHAGDKTTRTYQPLQAMSLWTDRIPTPKKLAETEKTKKEDADLTRLLKHGVEDAHFIIMVAQLPHL